MNRFSRLIANVRFLLLFLLSCLVLIGADQWTKALAVKYLKGQSDIIVIPKVFTLTYVENRGAAFGILNGRQWLLIGISIFFLIVILLFTMRLFHTLQQCRSRQMHTGKYWYLIACMAMIVAGAVGNLVDRIRLGYVVDFLYVLTKNLPILSFDFPVFNVADCCVTFAAFSVIFVGIFLLKEEEMNMIFGGRDDQKS